MSDYISREKAINTAHSMRKVCDTENCDDYHDLMVAALKDLPSSDAVEVVRCKDCRHYGAYHKADDHTKASIEKYGLKCVIMQRIMFPYNYCCFGDRGNDNE